MEALSRGRPTFRPNPRTDSRPDVCGATGALPLFCCTQLGVGGRVPLSAAAFWSPTAHKQAHCVVCATSPERIGRRGRGLLSTLSPCRGDSTEAPCPLPFLDV